jgi:2-polyprenyl-3-methyl-5-hydroxy-6-metoxy-1,4-benzoquinol methylase
VNGNGHEARAERQATQYEFPYHWLPSTDDGTASLGRALSWGLEYLAVLDATAELIAGAAPARVLDFGCGDGRLAVELARRGVPEVVGVDVVEQAIAFARAFAAPLGARVQFDCVSVEELDAGTFDVAVAMEVLEHIADDDLGRIVEALWRRVREDGTLVVSVPTTNVSLIAKHERHYTEELLRRHLAPRFEIVAVAYVHRVGVTTRALRRVLTNRLVSLEESHLRRAVTDLYRRVGRSARPDDGAHLVARCRRT